MQSLSSNFSVAKRKPGARKGRRHTVVRISRSADTSTFDRCSWLTGVEFEDGCTRLAAHASSNRLPEQAARAFNSVRRFTATHYTLRYRTRLLSWASPVPNKSLRHSDG